MSKCPGCGAEVATPFVFNLEGCSKMACPNCKARLGVGPLRSLPLTIIVLSLVSGSSLHLLGHTAGVRLAGVAFVLSIGNALFMLWEFAHPRLRLRKRPKPDPETVLNLH
jgi:hypothetical protein